MPADLVTRLLLKNDDFDRRLQQSKKQVQTFEKGIGVLRSGVMKFAGVIGMAVTAGEGFNRIINSSQTLSDAYSRNLEGLKGTVDNFFYSLGNGDWSPFLQGLTNTINLAKEAYNAMDQLGNTRISYGYFNMKNQAGLQDQITILRDKTSTDQERDAAKAKAKEIIEDQREITEQLSKRSVEAMQALIKASTGLSGLDVSLMDMEAPLRLDVSALGDADKERLSKQYKEFIQKTAAVKKQFETTQYGYTPIIGTYKQTELDADGFNDALKPLLAQYQKAIVYNATLVKESDDWLINYTNIAKEAFNANRALSGMENTFNRAGQKDIKSATKERLTPGSPAYLDSQIADLTKKLSKGTNESVRVGLRNAIERFKEEKHKIELGGLTEGSLDYINAQIAHTTQKLNQEADKAVRFGLYSALEKFNKEKHWIELEATLGKNLLKGYTFNKPIGKKPSDTIDAIKTGKDKISIHPAQIDKSVIASNYDYADSLQAIGSVLSSVTNLTNEGAAAWLSYGANIVTASASAVSAILSMIPVKKADATANTEQAATGLWASMASVPVVGWIMAGAAVATMIASIASIPKFAGGGIVPGNMNFGDRVPVMANSGEMILNHSQQGNLFRMIQSGVVGNTIQVGGKITAEGSKLAVLIEKVNDKKKRVR